MKTLYRGRVTAGGAVLSRPLVEADRGPVW